MKETIRTTIFPIFLISSISFTLGLVIGVYLGIVEDNIVAFTAVVVTILVNPFIVILDRYWRNEKRTVKN